MGSAIQKTPSSYQGVPDTYSHVVLSLATTDTVKTSRTAVGSISTILPPNLAWKPSDLTKFRGLLANQQGNPTPTASRQARQ